MAYTTQVHSYTLITPNDNVNVWSNEKFYKAGFLSTTKLDTNEYFKYYLDRNPQCEIIYNGLIDAKEITKYNQGGEVTLEGYKHIHTNKDSRGSYVSDVYVPKDWDDNHPRVQHIKGIALGQRTSQDRYYSQKWV